MPLPPPSPDPARILELIEAFRWSKTLFAAVSLGLFDTLEAGPLSRDRLAERLGATREALGRLLDACVSLGLLRRLDDTYELTLEAATYLRSSSPESLTGYIRYSNNVLWKLWGNLEDATREGRHRWSQTFGGERSIFDHFFRTEASTREFLLGMHGYGRLSSPRVVTAFDLSSFRRLVDLGGATGHLALSACEHYPQLRAVVVDLPEVIPLAAEILRGTSVAERVEVMAADFFVDPLPEGDLYALGRILHDWGEDQIHRLLDRICHRLPSGGGLLIAETLLDHDRRGPRWSQMQDLNMLVCTEGRERTLAEYEALLRRAGLQDIQGARTGAPLDAVLARKP